VLRAAGMMSRRGKDVRGALAAGLLASACAWNAADEPHEVRAPAAETSEECLLWGPWVAELASPELCVRLDEARALADKRDFEGALKLLDQPGDGLAPEPALHAARASLLVDLGFPRAAELEYVRALNLHPECAHLWRGLGLVRLRLGLENMAESALDNARSIDEHDLGLALTRSSASAPDLTGPLP